MRFVVFADDHRLGLLEGERVLDLRRAAQSAGLNADLKNALNSLQGLIETGARGLDAVSAAAEKLRGSDEIGLWADISNLKLQAPWPGQRFALAGSNNPSHLAEAFTHMGAPRSVAEAREIAREGVPMGFWGMARPVMGPGADIPIPARAKGFFDFESEPAIVLGKRGVDIKADRIADYVWGVTLVADWSIREDTWPPKPFSPFMPIKNFDCSKSIGPCIVVGELDPNDFQIETLVNGVRRQHFSSKEMIFSFGEVLQHFSQELTFYPGDVISGGTGAGTAMDQTIPNADGSWPRDLFLKPGDVVEARAEAIGSLIGRIVARPA